MPLDELLLSETPEGYQGPVDRFIPADQLIDQIAGGGSGDEWHEWFDQLDAIGALERTWAPLGSPARTVPMPPATSPLPGSVSADNGTIFGIAVCFASQDGARTYATTGAADAVPNGSVVPLDQPDARLTHVRRSDREAATALLRSGSSVVTFTIWSEGEVPVELLRALASAQGVHAEGL